MTPEISPQKLADVLLALKQSVDVLRSEMAQRRALPAGDIAWDQHVTLTLASGSNRMFDIVQDHGRMGVAATVTSATSGAKVGINGSTPFDVASNDEFTGARIGQIRLDNTSGSGDLVVVVFLAVTKATGAGAWA